MTAVQFHERLLLLLEHNDNVLSRTTKNLFIDTSASAEKKDGLLNGQHLAKRIGENRLLIATFIEWQSRRSSISEWEHAFCLVTLGYLAGLCILPAGLFREWEYRLPANNEGLLEVRATDIPSKILEFGMRSAKISGLSDIESRIATVGGLEWELVVGPLHPFYDGCGRVSRYFSTMLCLWNKLPVVQHSSRDEYFEHARRGRSAFEKYFVRQKRTDLL